MLDTIEPQRGQRHPTVTAVSSSAARREAFAQTLAQRFARKKQKILAVEAVGDESTVFRMTWPADLADQTHMQQLSKAEPFHRELRGMGFRALVLRAGERVVWSRSF